MKDLAIILAWCKPDFTAFLCISQIISNSLHYVNDKLATSRKHSQLSNETGEGSGAQV